VRAETRHQLKQDRFSRVTLATAEKTVHWTVEHQNTLIVAGVILLVIVGAVFGSWYYLDQQDQKASADLSRAVRTMSAPIQPPGGQPPEPGTETYPSIKDRAQVAHKQLQDIADKYPHTHAGEFARYFLGLTSEQMGDNADAEKNLKGVASSRNADLAALAKFALATVYRNTNRTKDAVDIYNSLISKPTQTVGKTMAQIELASTYQEGKQPEEAKKIYEQIQKENPGSEAAQIASGRLEQLK